MKNIRIMDCTLRDGGWINNFHFGTGVMQEMLHSAENAGITLFELGYLNERQGSASGYSMFSSMEAIRRNGLHEHGRDGILHFVMIDYGKFSVDNIPEASEGKNCGIDGIRLCFHKGAQDAVFEMGKRILDKGYRLLIQPMVTTRYSDDEFLELARQAEKEVPEMDGFYVVDSFGVMHPEEIENRVRLLDSTLPENVVLGVHVHNNMDLAFANAEAACSAVGDKRSLRIDCTLAGIGKGAGNLSTESFSEYVNREHGKIYNVPALRRLAQSTIFPLRQRYSWGSLPEYELTARYRVTPTYAGVFFREYHVSLQELEILLANMPEEKKDSFDREFAEAYLHDMLKKIHNRKPKQH